MSIVEDQPQTTARGLDELRALAGCELGSTSPLRIEQRRIDAFAELTEDRQWIHVDPARAADGPFGATIAHGYLTLSLCSNFLAQLLAVTDISMAVNYGVDRVRFPAPVRVGADLFARGNVIEVEDVASGVQARIRLTLEVSGESKPVCVADLLVRYYA